MIKVKGTKKLLLLSTALLALSSCTEVQELKTEVSNLPRLGKPKARVSEAKMKQIEHGNSIRKYIYANGYYKFIPIGKDTTVIVARNLDSGEDVNWNYIPLLYKFCKVHGGELVSGKGFERVYYKGLSFRDRFNYFGLGRTFYCEGGSYPFEVEHIRGRAGDDGGVLGWIPEAIIYIKHKPEPFITTKFGFNKQDLDKFSKEDLATFLNEETKSGLVFGFFFSKVLNLSRIGANKWKGDFGVKNPIPSPSPKYPDERMGSLWDTVEYCKAHGGKLEKDGKAFPVWFDEFIRRDKMFGYPYENENKKVIYPLNGIYACVGGNKPFEMKAYPAGYSDKNDFFYYHFILETGNTIYRQLYPKTITEETVSAEKESKPQAKPQLQVQSQVQSVPVQPQVQAPAFNPVLSAGFLPQLFAAKAVAMKSDFEKQQGAVLYKAYYDGVDDSNCDLASVLVNNAGAITVYNYRVCNGKISNPSESDLKESIPKEVKKAELKVARLARDYGAYSMEINGYRLYGKALRDKNYCQVEVRVLHGINLVRIDRLNGCQ